MKSEDSIVDLIYEAAIVSDLWPTTIEAIANQTGCYGGALFSIKPDSNMVCASQTCAPHLKALIEEGWAERNIRAQRLVSKAQVGFVTDHDLCSTDEIENHPIYTQFLRPRGLGWSIATYIAGADDDIVIFSIDQSFDKGPVSQSVGKYLDHTRPHIARAALLAAQFNIERIQGSLTNLEMLGIPAFAIHRNGKVRLANHHAHKLQSQIKITAFDKLQIIDDATRQNFHHAMASVHLNQAPCSLPAPGLDNAPPIVIHLIPVRRQARDIFCNVDAIVAVVPLNFPGQSIGMLMKKLYDLTQAETVVAEALISGLTVQAIAQRQGLSTETIRSHVKKVLLKTGSNRQADLIARFSGFHTF